MRIFLFKSFTGIVLTAFLMTNLTYVSWAQEATKPNEQLLDLVTGDIQTIKTKKLNRIAVANPDIVDISDAKADEVIIVGKKAGQTEVFVWDEQGKRSLTVRVASENLGILKIRILEIIEKSGLKGVVVTENPYEGKIVLSGAISKDDRVTLAKIMDAYFDKIINLVKEENVEDSVQIEAQIVELTASMDKNLGIDWTSGKQTTTNGQITTTVEGDTFKPTFLEVQPDSDGSFGDLFKIGNFYRSNTAAFVAEINALIKEGKGRVLSKPRLVVRSGKEASFLVGGEIPIRSRTISTTGSVEEITFKPYGVNMTITPTIRESKIEINLNVSIKDIDADNKGPSGDVAYTSREAQTQLLLDNKQTIVLAGLIRHTDSDNVRKVAFLGEIPILGALFRSRDTPRKDTEMVISLTPTILKTKRFATTQVKLPSKRMDDFVDEIDQYFEKEPIGGEDEPRVTRTQSSTTTITSVKKNNLEQMDPLPPSGAVSKGAPKDDVKPSPSAKTDTSSSTWVPKKANDSTTNIDQMAQKGLGNAPSADRANATTASTTISPTSSMPAHTTSSKTVQPIVKDGKSSGMSAQNSLWMYVRCVQVRISQMINYPHAAFQKNMEGTVKLRLRILKDGTLADADLLESSGNDIFDKDALNTAKNAAPYPPFFADMKQEDLVVTVPIVYNKSMASKVNTQTAVAAY